MKNKLLRSLFLLVCILLPATIFAQNIELKGVVKDATGEPVIGANVRLADNSNVGTVTDMDGNFSLSVPTTSKQVEVSYIGMQSQRVNISDKPINVVLKENSKELNEVVVIGYQTVKRKDLTGSVASVQGGELAKMPVANVAQALQGKMPGVNVISQDGRPNATISIRVRGGGSISQSNDPLILVDGVSVSSLSDVPVDQVESVDVLKDASSTAIYGARGANGVILITTKAAKEGKTTITYGGYVKFNTPTKYMKALDPYDYLSYVWANAAANGTAYQTPFEQLFGLGANAGSNTNGIESYRNVKAYNVQKNVYNSSVSYNHDLSISGGTDKTKILFAVNYMDDNGMKVNSYYKRANVNLKVDQKLFNNVDFALDTRYTDSQTLDDEGTTAGSGSILSSSYRFRPIATSNILGDLSTLTTGNLEQYGKNTLWDLFNPEARIKDYDPLTINQNIRSTASLNWGIIKGLTYHTELTLSRSWTQNKNWSGAIYNNYVDDEGNKLYAGAVDYEKSDSWGLRWTNTLNYDITLAKIHKINVLLGQEVTNSGGSFMRIQANHFPANFTKDNAFAMINQYDQTAGTSATSSGISIPGRIVSFFGRANYTLMDRYLFTLTFRADGSSKFSPEHRWGYFPAAAFAWRMSEEPFMKNITWLNNLKLRLSYGEVGNDGINSDLWSQLWTSETDRRWQYVLKNQYQTTYDLASSQMANKNLKWETTVTRDLGVDYMLFNNRVWGTVDLYWNTTKDLLMLTSIPGITGFTSTYANIGQTSNKGVEVSVSGLIYKNKNWNITAGANINFNKNNVDKLASNVTGLYGTNWASSSSYPVNDYVLEKGHAVGLIRGLVYDGYYTTKDFNYANGVYTLKSGITDVGNIIGVVHGIGNTERPSGQVAYPGLVKYKDLNNDGVIDDKDVKVIGNTNPKNTGGFNINVTYKNFDLGTYFNWSYGNDVYNVNKLASLYGPKESDVYDNKLSIVKGDYKIYDIENGQLVRLSTPDQLDAANKNASLPLAYNEGGVTSTLGIESGSYLRLNTLTIGYTLPKNLMSKVGISSLRVYGSIYNVFTITGYSGLDPEVNSNTAQNHSVYPTTGLDWGTYPRARSFVFGVNLSL